MNAITPLSSAVRRDSLTLWN